jgi:hypothetical protein
MLVKISSILNFKGPTSALILRNINCVGGGFGVDGGAEDDVATSDRSGGGEATMLFDQILGGLKKQNVLVDIEKLGRGPNRPLYSVFSRRIVVSMAKNGGGGAMVVVVAMVTAKVAFELFSKVFFVWPRMVVVVPVVILASNNGGGRGESGRDGVLTVVSNKVIKKIFVFVSPRIAAVISRSSSKKAEFTLFV